MDLLDRIVSLADQLQKQREFIRTEEATKMALVAPFIAALGYNVFDPREVTPEIVADIGTKKGEKVDYAILQDGEPIIIFECKTVGTPLEAHNSQLFRYFTALRKARIGILTNGEVFEFYSDIESENRLDDKPFLVIDLEDVRPELVSELKKIAKTTFDLDGMLSSAVSLKYTREIKRILAREFAEPSEEFIKFLAKRVHKGMITQNVREQFSGIIKNAIHQYLADRITARLRTAQEAESQQAAEAMEELPEEPGDGIETTTEEIEGFHVVKAICRQVVPIERIAMRDTKSYFGVLLDDNNRKPICRLHFNRSQKYLGVFNEEKKEERIPIDSIDEIYKYADKLKKVILHYEGTPAQEAAE